MDQPEHSELSEIVYYPKWEGAFLNCTLDYECDADWHALTPTDRENVRNCPACNREVHFCIEQSQLDRQAEQGHCVAFYEARPKTKKPRLGLPQYLIRDGVAVSYRWQARRAIDLL